MAEKHEYNTHFKYLHQEQSKDDCSLQTSSILKTPKPRKPLHDLDSNESEVSIEHTYTKRVSFNRAVKKKEYHVIEAETVWNATYEEIVKSSSDSSHQTDSSSCPNSMITGYDHLLSTRTSTTPSVKMTSVYPKGAESDKKDQFYGLGTTDEHYNLDEEYCLPLSKFNLQPSVDVDCTEHINNNPILTSKSTASDHFYYMPYETENSNLLEEGNDADMELTEALPGSLIRSPNSNEVNTQSMSTMSDSLCKNLTLSSDCSESIKGCDNLDQSDVSLAESCEYANDLTKHKEILLKTNLPVIPDEIFEYGDNDNNLSLELTEPVPNVKVSKKDFDLECSEVKKVESEEQIVINSRNQDIPVKINDTFNSNVTFSIEEQLTLHGSTINTLLRDASLKSVDESDEELMAILKKSRSKSYFNNNTRDIKGSEILDCDTLGIPSLVECKEKSGLFNEKQVHNSDKNVSEDAEVTGLDITCNMNNNVVCVPSMIAYDNDMELTDDIPHIKLNTSELITTSEETKGRNDMSLTCSDRGMNENLHNSELVKYTDGIASYMQLSDSMNEKRMPENSNPYDLDVSKSSSEMLDESTDMVQSFEVEKSTETSDIQLPVGVNEKEILQSVNLQTLELTRISNVSDISEFTCNLKGYEELRSKPLECDITTHVDEYINVIDIKSTEVLNTSEMEFTNDIRPPESKHLVTNLNECGKKDTLPGEVEQEEISLTENSMSITETLEFLVSSVNKFSDVGNINSSLTNPDGDKQNNSVTQTGSHDDSEKNKSMNCTILSEKSVFVNASEKLNKYTNSYQYLKNDEKAVCNMKGDSPAPENLGESCISSVDCDDTLENSVIKETHPGKTGLVTFPVETINSSVDFQSNDKQNNKENEHLREMIEHTRDNISNRNLDSIKQISFTDGMSASASSDDGASTIKNSILEMVVCSSVAKSCSKIPLEDTSKNLLHMKPNDSTKYISRPIGNMELNNSPSVSLTGVNIMSPEKPISSNNIPSEINISVPIGEKCQNSTESRRLNISDSVKLYETVETEKLDDISLIHSSSSSDEVNPSHDEIIYEHIVECVKEADENLREISKIASVTSNSILSSSVGNMEREEVKKDASGRSETVINALLTHVDDSVKFVKKKVECDHSTARKNVSESRDVTEKLTIEDKIKELRLSSGGDWIIKEHSETCWSYVFLYKTLELVVKLGEIVDDDLNSRAVTDIQLISYAADKADPLVKFVHKGLLQELQVQALKLKCKTTEQVIEVLNIVISEVNKLKIFMRNFIQLERLEMFKLKNNCAVYDVAEMDIRIWFRIKVNLNHWDNILPTDVSIENIIGETSEDEVKNLVTGAVRGPGCLLDFTRIVKEYIEVLCKNNIQD